MHIIVKVFSEIIIKSPPVRKRFIKQLRDNLRKLFGNLELGMKINVQNDWEKIEVTAPEADDSIIAQVCEVLAHTPGIANFSVIKAYPVGDLDDIFKKVLPHWKDALAGKTFCVRARRHGNHEFTSTQLEQYVGGGLLHHSDA